MEYAIRPWQKKDASSLAENLNNINIINNLRDGLPYPYTAEDGEEFIEAMLKADPHTQYAWAITENDKAIGSIGIFRGVNIHFRTAELGYYLGEPYWNKGIVSSSVQQACTIIFNTTDIIRIFAEPFATNEASCRVLENAGFTYEGLLRKNAVKNGEILDMKMYALVKA